MAEVVFAKDQPEYNRLPAIRGISIQVPVTSRWRLTWKERLQVAFSGNLWLTVWTFGKPLQPVKIVTSVEEAIKCQ
jgi:hypothetical protein